jgi:hypothetical protein
MRNLLSRLVLGVPLLLALAAPGAWAVVSLERAIETGSASLLMPTSENSTLTASACGRCRQERLTVTPQTRYFARDQAVPLATLRTLLTGSRPVAVTVFVRAKSTEVTRVVADVAVPR